ncbi:MAG: hypothetical protein LBV74_12470 [Tannerella sp.]|jgi:hypothetical protein|nr:hypothetical protein [Tannerella sp.]
MKRCIIYFLFLGISVVTLYAQENKASKQIGKFGVSFSSFGGDDFFPFASVDGGASYNSQNYYAFALNYLRDINQRLEFETGLEYSKHKFIIEPSIPDLESKKSSLSLINIPLTVRVNFWKYVFVNGGILVDIDVTKDSDVDRQTGLGVMMGVGGKYDLSSGLSVFVNPYFKIHSLLSFEMESIHYRLGNAGIRAGVTYAFGK